MTGQAEKFLVRGSSLASREACVHSFAMTGCRRLASCRRTYGRTHGHRGPMPSESIARHLELGIIIDMAIYCDILFPNSVSMDCIFIALFQVLKALYNGPFIHTLGMKRRTVDASVLTSHPQSNPLC